MNHKKLIALSLCLLLLLSGCGSGNDAPPEQEGYTVTLRSAAGTGYYWDCTLSEEGIVTLESEHRPPEDPTQDSMFTTEFRFLGKSHGAVTATFCCHQSWDDSVNYLYTCDLTVDRDKAVSGELSRQTAVIRPGSEQYKLTASDTSIALWSVGDDGSYTFTPLREGAATLTFTPPEQSAASVRIFYLTVTEPGLISITEDTGPKSAESYATLDMLEQKLGFPMPIPESAEPSEISSVGRIAYTSFTWNGIRFAYAAGDLDRGAFLSPDAEVCAVSGTSVILRNSFSTLCAWEKDKNVYCISSDEILSKDELLTLLTEILAD